MNESIIKAARLAIAAAKNFEGATAPNPPVGAAGLTKDGKIIAVAAHEKYGSPHAEANLIQQISVERLSDYDLQLAEECQKIITPYCYCLEHGKPWIIIKQAYNLLGNMVPRENQKTFTSQQSLVFAHMLRKKADVIITGSGTVLADWPKLTVRYVLDHPGKHRYLVLLDRSNRVPEKWKMKAIQRGFHLIENMELMEALTFLGQQGAHIALIEAGPTLSQHVINHKLWNERIEIFQSTNNASDKIIQTFNLIN